MNMKFHPISKTIVELLQADEVWFETFEHEAVTTSEDAARVRPDYSLHQGAKAIVVKGEKKNKEEVFLMLVVPADLRLDSKKVKGALDLRSFRFATEEEISDITQGIQRGGVPPFGNLFFKPVAVYIDPKMFENERIIFNAGDRCFSVAMISEDYKRLVCPLVVDIVES
jgi:Ala-tRNA(Pro) deacylase